MLQVSKVMDLVIMWTLGTTLTTTAGANFDVISHIDMMNLALQNKTPLLKEDINQYYDEIRRGVNETTTTQRPALNKTLVRPWVELDSADNETMIQGRMNYG